MTDLRDKFRGALFGLAIGDAVGSRYEGMSAGWIISERLGNGGSIFADLPDEIRYTDDTQMAIGVAQTLVQCGEIDQDRLVANFVANYQPWRGYGRGARQVLEVMEDGGDWRAAARNVFPGGSFGNGAAMRVAPVGAYFYDDLDRVWDQARLSAMPTHVHELGVEGARLLALAVAMCTGDGDGFNRAAFYGQLSSRCTTPEFRAKLDIARHLSSAFDISRLGNGIEAHESVVTAIACFTLSPDSYPQTIDQAIRLGGDTDTIAAMAGACSGAYLGYGAIPAQLLQFLEDGPGGRSDIDQLALDLHASWENR